MYFLRNRVPKIAVAPWVVAVTMTWYRVEVTPTAAWVFSSPEELYSMIWDIVAGCIIPVLFSRLPATL